MIEEIYIKNFILIEEESIQFKNGLNIITGETGAGKSIILRAINILLGDVAKTDYIGDFSDQTIIEGTFLLNEAAEKFLEKYGIEADQHRIIITREMSEVVSTISRINGRRITVKLLKSLGEHLIDFHGQNQHQSLLDTSYHSQYLDSIDSDSIEPLLNKIKGIVLDYKANVKKLDDLIETNDLKDRELDFVEFQLNEINNLELKEGEIESLEKEFNYLSNSERIQKIVGGSLNHLKSDDGLYDTLQDIIYDYNSIEKFDDSIEDINEKIKEIFYLSEIVIDQIQNYFYDLEFDEFRLKEINQRMDAINSVLKKYGNTYDALIEYKTELEEKLEKYNSLEKEIKRIKNENENIIKEYYNIADQLTKVRKNAAQIFEKRINSEFNELNMKNSNIKVQMNQKDDLSANGQDVIELLISTNLGQPFKSLKDIVSGGELSRTMLAIKLITKNMNSVPTLIFDEVDTGISGVTADIIGKKLKKISENLQIITITHLPQIAAFSDHHISVNKSVDDSLEKTISEVKILSKEEKVEEVAKLISGSNVTKMSMKSATELIEKAVQ
jgi:DNA repair protein RecN (Recombination protein N)